MSVCRSPWRNHYNTIYVIVNAINTLYTKEANVLIVCYVENSRVIYTEGKNRFQSNGAGGAVATAPYSRRFLLYADQRALQGLTDSINSFIFPRPSRISSLEIPE
jgi:hypothetical protein